jgi:hypothetical protein
VWFIKNYNFKRYVLLVCYFTSLLKICILYLYFFRELAFQIADQFRIFGKGIGVVSVKVTVITGGMGTPFL